MRLPVLEGSAYDLSSSATSSTLVRSTTMLSCGYVSLLALGVDLLPSIFTLAMILLCSSALRSDSLPEGL